MHVSKISWLALLFIALLSCFAIAQEPGTQAVPIPDDEFDRGTPVRSAEGFVAAAEAGDFETAAEYLDLRNLRGEASELSGPQLARRLHVIVMRANWIDVDELVDDPRGRDDDGQPSYRDSIGVVLDEGKELWRFKEKRRIRPNHGITRSVPAVDGKYVFSLDPKAVLHALDAETGALVWEVVTVDQSLNYTITGAPRIVEGKVDPRWPVTRWAASTHCSWPRARR